MLRYLLPSLLFTFSCVASIPNDPNVLRLWDGPAPNHQESEQEEVITDRPSSFAISQVQIPTIEVRLPARRSATGHAVVICPGGGYARLSYNWEGVDIASALNAKGIAAIILKSRLPDDDSNIEPRLSPLLDAKRAMRLVRQNAEDWSIDPAKIGVMGFSAGGHLASTLGTQFDMGDPQAEDMTDRISSRPDFMILMYPVISMREGITHAGSRKNLLGENPSEELVEQYSNELQITENTPPTFLVHSSDDGAVPVANSILFYQSLLDHSVEAEMHLYPYGGHGFGLALGRGRLEEWSDLCIQWIKAH
ncbi:alpha/beta hydrolase [Pelagicoccus albus]|uniref:Alpha/beta hydrolase n=1 Tax=Pelagicoccus albus TaxID=415222 RepID=A0A7X1B6D6_9BACT|nr:alpha/beta hydrolase [Pelagicoccus albus]MBC2605353.1 alpha/beta hydrolase [Pelagicoccus albus]